jgi:hypothetical protein
MLVETRKALGSISDAIEVTKMLEELMTPGREAQLMNVLPGLRIALKEAREKITKAHTAIALDVVNTAKERIAEMKQNRVNIQAPKAAPAVAEASINALNAASAPKMEAPISRLAAAVETIVES